jgi:hypothetical protein
LILNLNFELWRLFKTKIIQKVNLNAPQVSQGFRVVRILCRMECFPVFRPVQCAEGILAKRGNGEGKMAEAGGKNDVESLVLSPIHSGNNLKV